MQVQSNLRVRCAAALLNLGRIAQRGIPSEPNVGPSVLRGVVSQLRNLLRTYAFPDREEWVQVRSGYSSGLWFRLNLSRERTWWAGNNEPAVQQFLANHIREGTVFYDVGAHLGFYALPAARAGARVIAFEADPENAARLRLHIERNDLVPEARVIEAAAWSSSEESLEFRRGQPRSQGGVSGGRHRATLATGKVIAVPAVRIDDVVRITAAFPEVIKIDVEGAESEVLLGAVETIKSAHPTLTVEVHTANQYRLVRGFLERQEYDLHWFVPREGFPRQCFALHGSERAKAQSTATGPILGGFTMGPSHPPENVSPRPAPSSFPLDPTTQTCRGRVSRAAIFSEVPKNILIRRWQSDSKAVGSERLCATAPI